MKKLVAYFSATGTTIKAAERLAKAAGRFDTEIFNKRTDAYGVSFEN